MVEVAQVGQGLVGLHNPRPAVDAVDAELGGLQIAAQLVHQSLALR
jgi:hypothetical protein